MSKCKGDISDQKRGKERSKEKLSSCRYWNISMRELHSKVVARLEGKLVEARCTAQERVFEGLYSHSFSGNLWGHFRLWLSSATSKTYICIILKGKKEKHHNMKELGPGWADFTFLYGKTALVIIMQGGRIHSWLLTIEFWNLKITTISYLFHVVSLLLSFLPFSFLPSSFPPSFFPFVPSFIQQMSMDGCSSRHCFRG